MARFYASTSLLRSCAIVLSLASMLLGTQQASAVADIRLWTARSAYLVGDQVQLCYTITPLATREGRIGPGSFIAITISITPQASPLSVVLAPVDVERLNSGREYTGCVSGTAVRPVGTRIAVAHLLRADGTLDLRVARSNEVRYRVGEAVAPSAAVAPPPSPTVQPAPLPPPPAPPSAPSAPASMWIAPADGTMLTSPFIRLVARARDSTRGTDVEQVNFTFWHPGLGPINGPWGTACSVSSPVAGSEDVYQCDLNFTGVVFVKVLVSFDVYDRAGTVTYAPAGARTIYNPPPGWEANKERIDTCVIEKFDALGPLGPVSPLFDRLSRVLFLIFIEQNYLEALAELSLPESINDLLDVPACVELARMWGILES